MRHALWLGLFAFTLLAVEAGAARADIPGPDGKATRRPWGYGAPPPGWFEQNGLVHPPPVPDGGTLAPPQPVNPDPPVRIDPITGLPRPPQPPVPPPPKRTGPFRSCGSGMGVGLAGIGAAWAMLWLGNRFARGLSRSPSARG